ncbi:fused MFS/spermidine synthase [Chthonobacter rhizosphaerae]|uniref:fused MFS/spermidine synthase n=1 Tax=Chthonobacter rhizosphaerae TaxID=2735553 RepID=UPI0015EF4A6D|nr:fused MFS/spermidine synthase [Chthonobacter rhizosphaerae]
MTNADTDFSLGAARASAGAGVAALFAATLFLSAFLLFSVQPMFAKLVLPRLGGSASVWSVAMVFFQAMLLAGYAFAHLLTSRFEPKVAVVAQLTVLAGCLTVLPVALPDGWGAPPESGTAFWLMGLFAAAVGLPFFAVAVNGPLLQAWFARTGHPHARDPYFLYGASNIGSFAALIAYPILVETTLGGHAQTLGWTGGFVLLAVMIAACGGAMLRSGPVAHAIPVERELTGDVPSLGRRLQWIALAFVPSALLVAVTAHISTDIAAVPFLWVVPLALFLLTFVLTFRRNAAASHRRMLTLQPIALGILVVVTWGGLQLPLPAGIAVHLAVFFITAMVCHGELVRRRPPPARLTEFYLLMSLGGVLGGGFATLAAPVLFSTVVEYPLLLVAGLLCRPGVWSGEPSAIRRDASLIAALALALGLPAILRVPLDGVTGAPFAMIVAAAAGLSILARRNDRRFAGFMALVVAGALAYDPFFAKAESHRSFYGVHRVVDSPDGEHRLLMHGTTMHGVMRIRNADGSAFTGRPEPLAYYWDGSGIGQAISAVRAAHGGRLGDVAVVGLGSGGLACAAEPSERWRFLEIDPVVAAIARDPDRFRYLQACTPDAPVVIGDARLTMAADDGIRFDLVVVDAFSSDAIPVHLMTREAVRLFVGKTTERGAVVFHVSNRHMELTSVVAAAAAAEGWVAVSGAVNEPKSGEPFRLPTQVVVIARDAADLAGLAATPDFHPVRAGPAVSPWTDDFSNVLGAVWRNYAGRPGYERVD